MDDHGNAAPAIDEPALTQGLAGRLLLFVIATRASADIVLDEIRIGGEGGFTGGAILNILVLILAGSQLFRGSGGKVPTLALWAGYVAIELVSLLLTPDLSGGIRLFLSTLTFPAVFLTAFRLVRSDADQEALCRVILWSSVPTAAAGVWELATKADDELRLQATFAHPNIFAFYLVLVISVTCYWRVIRREAGLPTPSRLHLPYLAVLAGLLVATGCRSAWIAMLATFLISALALKRSLLWGALALPLLLLSPAVQERLSDIDLSSQISADDITRGEQVGSYAWRQILWEHALADSADDRLIGKGLGAFRANAPYFFPLEDAADAHSAFVQNLYELGLVGLLLYLGIHIALLVKLGQGWPVVERRSVIVAAVVVGYLLESYSDNMPYYLTFNWYIWAFLGAHLSCLVRWRRSATTLSAAAGLAT